MDRGGVTRVIDGERGCRREGVKVLTKGVRGDCLVVGGDEVVELEGEEV